MIDEQEQEFDEESWEYDGPSKSARKREQHALQQLLEDFLALAPRWRDSLELPDSLALSLRLAAKQKPSSARNRQMRYSTKLLNSEGEELIEAFKEVLAASQKEAERENFLLHESERWRERLLNDSQTALTEYIAAFPGQDIQQLRQLIRQTQGTSPRNKEAQKKLFRSIREQLKKTR